MIELSNQFVHCTIVYCHHASYKSLLKQSMPKMGRTGIILICTLGNILNSRWNTLKTNRVRRSHVEKIYIVGMEIFSVRIPLSLMHTL